MAQKDSCRSQTGNRKQKMIKAVFLDIDGTMVAIGEKQMRPSLVEAFDRLHAAGIKVFVASGRSRFIISNLRDYPFDGYITMNGGLATIGDEVICSVPIERKLSVELARRIEESGISSTVFCADGVGINHEDEISRMVFGLIHLPPFPLLDIVENAKVRDVYEYTIFMDEATRMKYFADMADKLNWERWHPQFLDIMSPKASKGDAMCKIAEALGLGRDEIMAFGDGGNDLTMIQMAGIGVAMGNGNESVKTAADYITDSVDNDGVVTALEHFGLINR